jgi:hypothetical protein
VYTAKHSSEDVEWNEAGIDKSGEGMIAGAALRSTILGARKVVDGIESGDDIDGRLAWVLAYMSLCT